MQPLCRCNFPMYACISNTYDYQGCRFWKCCQCESFILDDDIIPGVTPMVEDDIAMKVLMESRSKVEGVQNQDCTRCGSIDEVIMASGSSEIAKWKTKYGDENKKVKWMTLVLIFSWFLFVCYVNI